MKRAQDAAAVTADVVIPTFNNVDELRVCLASLATQTLPPQKVFVCVDGSDDGTQQYLAQAQLGLDAEVIEHADGLNHGRALTRNLAIPRLQAPFVLFLDSDMVLRADALEHHIALLMDQECVSIGDVVYRESPGNLWARYQGTRGKNKKRAGEQVRALDFNTQNTALSTADLLAAGGFDSRFSTYGGEDTELGLRLARVRRLTFVFNASAVATTTETKTVSAGLAQLREFGRVNMHLIRDRHPSAPAPFWIDQFESDRFQDRLLRAAMNPLTDMVAGLLLRIPWFPIQRRLLNYKVLRAVWTGYREGRA